MKLAIYAIGVILAFILSSQSVNAGCANDSQRKPECSKEECKARYALVHPTCDVSKVCSKKSPKEQLLESIEKHKKCLAVREKVAECFIAPDDVHKEQIQTSHNGINKCNLMLQKLK